MYYAYLIALDRPLGGRRHRAQFYLGIARDVALRLHEHRTGQGAKMLAAAVRRRIKLRVVRIWQFPSRAAAAAFEMWAKRSVKCHRLLLNLEAPPLLV